jgi:Transglycosylase SLT domain
MKAGHYMLQFATKIVAACALLVGAGVAFDAQADVWVHVDAQGVTHFAPNQVDARYELFYRGPVSSGTAPSDPPERPAAPLPTLKELKPKLAQFFESSPRYKQMQPFIQEAARIHRVDYELLQALIAAESGFDPEAISVKGAIGLMQIMPDTARRFGVDSDRWSSVESKLKNPRLNLQLGARYLRLLIDMFPGRLDLALASYNAGEGAVQKAGNAIPNFKETQGYVVMVTQLYTVLKPPAIVATTKNMARPTSTFGPGFVLNTSREPYALVLSGRGNMVQPIRNTSPSSPDDESSVAVD